MGGSDDLRSDHAKAVKEMSEDEVGGGHHLKEMYVLQVQGKGKTFWEGCY